MNKVTFNQNHSYTHYHLILNSKEIENPSAKKILLDIPGADGFLDFTEAFGDVMYSNRQIKFMFTIDPAQDRTDYISLYETFTNDLHGKYVDIILSEDDLYIYKGRVDVGTFKIEKGILSFDVTCDCDPFKYNATPSNVSATVSGSATFIFTFEGNTYTHVAGVFSIPEIELKPGANTVSVAGNGNVYMAYTEGRL